MSLLSRILTHLSAAGSPGTKSALHLESLEAREVPATVSWRDGLLTVGLVGDPDHNVTISKQITPHGYVVTVDGEYKHLAGGGKDGTIPADKVKQIVVNGDDFANRINVRGVSEVAYHKLDNKVFLYGNGGNDAIYGSAFGDVIYGGANDDRVEAGGGNDWIFGEGGQDDLRGESGNDILFGGDDKDDLNGGFDNDILFGGEGDDHLRGSTGKDTLVGEGGADILEGNQGADKYLRDAADTVYFSPQDGDSYITTPPVVPTVPKPKH